MIYPDYKGGSVLNLMASIKRVLGGKSKHKELRNFDLKFENNLILILIDGLGYNYLTKNCKDSFLHKNLQRKITSVFPSTTAAAATTLITGLAPVEHGIVGWRFFEKNIGGIIHPLPFSFWQKGISLENKEIEFPKIYSKNSFYEEIKEKSFSVSREKFVKSSFSLECQRGAKMIPFVDLKDMFLQLEKTCKKEGKKFIYTYWNEFDYNAHRQGLKSPELKNHFKEIDKAIEEFSKKIKGTKTTLIITADHGQLENRYINLSKDKEITDCLAMPICGEIRFAYCYVKKGKENEFENVIKTKYEKYLNLHKSKALVEKGMLGPLKQNNALLGRMGDYTIIMKDDYALSDFFTLVGRNELFKSNHGGFHEDEMLVPLIVIKA